MNPKNLWLHSGVNLLLIGCNAVVFLLSRWNAPFFYGAGALTAGAVLRGKAYYRLITAMFLHADITHIGSNMLILFFVGAIVERNIGHIRYLLFYLTTGVCGNLLSVWYEAASGETWISYGASGAVFGVLGAVLVLVMRGRAQIRRGSTLPVRVAVMVLFSLYSGTVNAGTNNAAHIGGLLAGLLLAAALTERTRTVDLRGLL